MPKDTINLHNLTKKFGKKTAVDNVSLAIKPGEVYGFLGPNGAGKTTTIRLIMGFIKPTGGQVKVFGRDNIRGVSAQMNQIGYLSADSSLYASWTASQHFDFASKIRSGKTKALELAEQFELDTGTKFHRLSSGNKQKLALILALMHSPKLLILDEPTRGLDPLLQQEIYTILRDFKKDGGAVFMSSHNLAEVEHVCDRVGIIREGKLAASESIQGIRQMHVHEVRVLFADGYIRKYFEGPNLEIKKATKQELIVHVRGDLNNFLRQVVRFKVRDIEITHASLEDIFMRFYQ